MGIRLRGEKLLLKNVEKTLRQKSIDSLNLRLKRACHEKEDLEARVVEKEYEIQALTENVVKLEDLEAKEQGDKCNN